MSNKGSAPLAPDFVLRSRDTPITCVSFLLYEGNAVLLSGNQSGVISVWSLRSRRITSSTDAHPGHAVLWIHSHQHESHVVLSFGRDGIINKWQITPSHWIKVGSFETSSIGFCPCTYLPDASGTLIAAPSMQQSVIHLIEMDSNQVITKLAPKDNKKNGMCMYLRSCVISDKCHLMAGYEDGSIALWDISSGVELSRTGLHGDALMAFDYHFGANRGVSGSVDEQLSIFKLTEQNEISKIASIEITNPGINAIAVRKDGRLFVTGGWDGAIRVFSTKKCSPLAVLSWHNQGVQTLAFSEDNTLAAGSKDGNISIWSIYKT